MNVEAQKLEIIEWLLTLKDDSAIRQVMKVKNALSVQKPVVRRFGSGKNIFTYVAEDFDEPLQDFKEYMK